jgi:hypothetical protein
MYNLSSAEGPRFAEIAREMTERVRAMGPNPLGRPSGDKEVISEPTEASASTRVSGVAGEH